MTVAPAVADIFSTPELRVEGRSKVSGSARYSADFTRDGMLWAAFVTSPIAHGRVVSIDVSAAKKLPGVRAVLTGADIGERYFGRALCDWPVLAVDRVLFIGQYVVAVAADTRERAQAAAAAVDVVYAELPALFDANAVTEPDAVILHADPARYPFHYGQRPPVAHPNIQGSTLLEKGDPGAAIARADRVFTGTFHTPRHHGGYIEPHATLVWIGADGIVRVITTNKAPFSLRAQMALTFGLPPESIVIEQAFIGGDFGAKGLTVDAFPAYYLARATGCPVKTVRSYLEDIQSTNVRHASSVSVTVGVTAAGRLTALDVDVVFDGGAFAAAKPIPTLTPGTAPKLPYCIPNARIAISAVYTNTIPAGHVRAPADVQTTFAIESQLDVVARELGIDPLEFRLLNAVKDDEADVDGNAYREPRALEVLEQLRFATGGAPLVAGRGRGIALTCRHIGHGRAGIVLSLRRDGTIAIQTTLADQGAGSATVFQRIVARELALPADRIVVEHRASDRGPMDMGPGASRVTHVTGQAVLVAATELRVRLESHGWNGTPHSFAGVAKILVGEADSLEIAGAFDGFPKAGEPEYHNFSACMADVTVDRETGALTVNELLFVADVGTIINPVAHRGQIEGGLVYCLGNALMEEVIVDEGKIVNLSLADYKLPSQRDVPPMRIVLMETPAGPGPFGAKAAGELSTAGVAPAIANAVAMACGVRITSLPITAERIFEALNSA